MSERCQYVMLSGLRCVRREGHDGDHQDRFGLRDPREDTSND